MTLKIHPWAISTEITVGAAESIVVQTEGIAKVYSIVGYPNVPGTKSLVGTVNNALTIFGPYASGATIVIETNHEPAKYEVGANPTIDSYAPVLQQGATAAQGEAVELRGGTSTTAANAGGAAALTGGTGGSTGNGGAATVSGGASGTGATGNGGAAILQGADASSTNGNGGNARVVAGAKSGTGVDGMVKLEGVQVGKQGAPTAKTVAVTLTAAELLTGMIQGTHAAGANQDYTLPTGTLLDAAVQMSAGEYFDWVLTNLSAAAADTITLAAGADHTVEGVMVVQSVHATTGGLYGSSARFRTRKTAANTFITYRI